MVKMKESSNDKIRGSILYAFAALSIVSIIISNLTILKPKAIYFKQYIYKDLIFNSVCPFLSLIFFCVVISFVQIPLLSISFSLCNHVFILYQATTEIQLSIVVHIISAFILLMFCHDFAIDTFIILSYGITLVVQKLLILTIVTYMFYIISVFFGFLILYVPDLLNQKHDYAIAILIFFIVFVYYKIIMKIFSYLISDIFLAFLINQNTQKTKNLIFSFKNTFENLFGISCILINTQEFENRKNIFIYVANKIKYFFSYIAGIAGVIYKNMNIYETQIAALYKICTCNKPKFIKFQRNYFYIYFLKDSSHFLFSLKWLFVGYFGYLKNIFCLQNFNHKYYVIDKEIQSRIFSFYCFFIAISFVFEILSACWKSIAVAYTEDPNCIKTFNNNCYLILLQLQ
ncbi:hypothetical protein GVAV_000670 [Gurleya vavrai]